MKTVLAITGSCICVLSTTVSAFSGSPAGKYISVPRPSITIDPKYLIYSNLIECALAYGIGKEGFDKYRASLPKSFNVVSEGGWYALTERYCKFASTSKKRTFFSCYSMSFNTFQTCTKF